MKSSILLAALAASIPAAAQTPRGDAEVAGKDAPVYAAPAGGASPCGDAEFLRDMQAYSAWLKQNPVPLNGGGTAKPAAKPSREDGLKSTLTAMGDGISVGGVLLARLDADKTTIDFKSQAAASSRSLDGKTISLSDALPPAPRVLAPYIAREAAEALLADIPVSAEKEYMRVSYMTRVWLELGGERKKLPLIETLESLKYEDKVLAGLFKRWMESYQDADASAFAVPSLAELKTKAKDAAEKAAIEKAQKRFKAFTDEEVEWYNLNKGTVAL